jgi:choline dehydrogenase-like flavoprotein
LHNVGAKGIHKTQVTAAHPGGTVKIGELVDTDLKTEYNNLYVCDCSVIPEPWGLPPTATIICLGKRLGKHLLSLA